MNQISTDLKSHSGGTVNSFQDLDSLKSFCWLCWIFYLLVTSQTPHQPTTSPVPLDATRASRYIISCINIIQASELLDRGMERRRKKNRKRFPYRFCRGFAVLAAAGPRPELVPSGKQTFRKNIATRSGEVWQKLVLHLLCGLPGERC